MIPAIPPVTGLAALALRPLVGPALGLCLGGWAAWSWPGSFAPAAVALGVAVAAAVALPGGPSREARESLDPLRPRPGRLIRLGRERVLLCACLLAAAGGAWRVEADRRTTAVAASLLPPSFDGEWVAEGPPETESIRDSVEFWRCRARLVAIGGQSIRPCTVRLSGFGRPVFERGDRILGRVEREAVLPAACPGAWDAAREMRIAGEVARLRFRRPFGLEGEPWTVLPASAPPWRRAFDRARAAGIAACLDSLPGRDGEFLAAITFGYRVPRGAEGPGSFADLREDFRRVGLGHLLAISGMNVAILTGLAWWLFSRFFHDRRLLGAACIPVAVGYALVSGLEVSAVRACVMAVVHLAGFVLARRSDLLNSLGAAGFLLALASPLAFLDLGFQLSFAAVVFLSRFAPSREEEVRWRGLRDGARLSLAAAAGCAPLVALAFRQASPVGVLVNLLVLPLSSLVLAAGAAVPVAVLPINPYPEAALWLLDLPVRLLIAFADVAAGLPVSSLEVCSPSGGAVALYYAAFGAFFLRRCVPVPLAKRWTAGTVGGIALACAAMVAGAVPNPPSGPRILLLPGWRTESLILEADGERIGVGRSAARLADFSLCLGGGPVRYCGDWGAGESPGIEVRRDAKGAPTGAVLRRDGLCAAVAWSGRFFREGLPAGVQVVVFCGPETAESRPEAWAAPWIFASRAPPGQGRFVRAEWGAIELTLGPDGGPRLRAYDGVRWREGPGG